jgi:hypothetical protein
MEVTVNSHENVGNYVPSDCTALHLPSIVCVLLNNPVRVTWEYVYIRFCYHSAETWANMKLNVAVSNVEYVESDDGVQPCAEQDVE